MGVGEKGFPPNPRQGAVRHENIRSQWCSAQSSIAYCFYLKSLCFICHRTKHIFAKALHFYHLYRIFITAFRSTPHPTLILFSVHFNFKKILLFNFLLRLFSKRLGALSAREQTLRVLTHTWGQFLKGSHQSPFICFSGKPSHFFLSSNRLTHSLSLRIISSSVFHLRQF